jgi:hypothetical protein
MIKTAALKYAGIALLLTVYSAGLVFAGYSYAQKGKSDAVIDSLKKDKKLVQQAKAETRVVEKQVIKYVDRIKTVIDTTGCADVPADTDINHSLQQIYSATARPPVD